MLISFNLGTTRKLFTCFFITLLSNVVVAERWTTLAPPPVAASSATTTVLSDGRILRAGGRSLADSNPLALAYVYNPSTNQWTSVGSMLTARYYHAATLLSSGRVLVTGGIENREAEIFDPSTMAWTRVAPMTDARYSHQLTLLNDGAVLLTGGLVFLRSEPTTAQLYDERTNSWRDAGRNAATGRSAAVRLASGDVLVTGGEGTSASGLYVSELYSVATNTWNTTSPLQTARLDHKMVLLPDGSVLAVGGTNFVTTLDSVEKFDPSTRNWTSVASTLAPRTRHTLVRLNDGRVAVIGGASLGETSVGGGMAPENVPDVEVYTPQSGSWVGFSPMRETNGTVAAIQANDERILAFGVRSAEVLELEPDAPSGSVDPVWGVAGRRRVTTSVPAVPFVVGIRAAAYDPRSGSVTLASMCTGGACLVRLDRRGNIDQTYGSAGTAKIAVSTVLGLHVQPDGKALVASLCSGLCITRLNFDGSIDSGFGIGGLATADSGTAWRDVRIALSRDGRIHAVGTCSLMLCAYRFSQNGVVDILFADGRGARTGSLLLGLQVLDAAVSSEGTLSVISLCRYKHPNPSYVVTENFPCYARIGVDGRAITSPAGSESPARVAYPSGYSSPLFTSYLNATVLLDGRTMAAYSCTNDRAQTEETCVIRLSEVGALEQSFGVGGYVKLGKSDFVVGGDCGFGIGPGSYVAAADGSSILFGGCSSVTGIASSGVKAIRLDSMGRVDSSFSGSIASRFSPEAALATESGTTTILGRWSNGSGIGGAPQSFVAYRMLGATTSKKISLVEFIYAPLNYYFVTARAQEQLLLDGAAGWLRTGESIPVFAADATDRSPIHRFYFDRVARNATRGSHFYTLIDVERRLLDDLNPTNTPIIAKPFNEGVDGYALQANASGTCPSNTQPVYRLFRGNARFPDDPNHRFTVKRSLYDQFVTAGRDGEGVKFCSPF